jgi:hypothetical protein
MKAITTRFLGPTDTKGARIIASDCDRNKVTIPYDYNGEESYRDAAIALCVELGWEGTLVGGHLDNGMVWVFVDDHAPTFTL